MLTTLSCVSLQTKWTMAMLHVACLHGLTGGVFFSEFGKWQNVNISILNEQKRTQWQTPIYHN
jgi:hypothetical protein